MINKVWKILESKDKESDSYSGVGNAAHPNQSIKNVNGVLVGRDTVLLKFSLTNKKQHLFHSWLIKIPQVTAQSYLIKTSNITTEVLYSQIRYMHFTKRQHDSFDEVTKIM